jgi:NitT/TauT family transport system substrate-binding protein
MSTRALSMLLLAIATLVGCEGSTPAPDARARIRVQLNWVPEPEFGGFYAAQFDGLFRDAGLEVELIKDPGGAAVPQMVDQGVCEAGVMSGDQILQLREQGGDLVAIFNVFDHTPYGIMMHAAAAPTTLEAVWKGTGNLSVETGLPVWKYLNAKFGKPTRTEVPYNAVTATFLADPTIAVQCFITSEPVTMDLQKVSVKVFNAGEAGYDPYTVVVAVKRGRLPEAVLRRFASALQEGWKRYMSNPAKYNPGIAALNPAMGLEAMNLAAERMKPLLLTPFTETNGLGAMDEARWKMMVDTLVQSGVVKTAPPASTLFERLLPAPTVSP